MGAKSKPQESLTVADLGLGSGDVGEGWLAHGGARPRQPTAARRDAEARGRRLGRTEGRRPARREEARLNEDARLPGASRRRHPEGLARRAVQGGVVGRRLRHPRRPGCAGSGCGGRRARGGDGARRRRSRAGGSAGAAAGRRAREGCERGRVRRGIPRPVRARGRHRCRAGRQAGRGPQLGPRRRA